MSAKKGPHFIGEDRRSVTVRVRMEPREVAELDAIASEQNTTRSGIVRKGIELVKEEMAKQK